MHFDCSLQEVLHIWYQSTFLGKSGIFFFETAYFLKKNLDLQPVSSDSMQKVSEIDLKFAAQFFPLFLFGKKKKKFLTCAKESALIPVVENLLQ